MGFYDIRPDKRKGSYEWQKSALGDLKGLKEPIKRFHERLAEVSMAKANGDYSQAYDLADKLLADMDEHKYFYSDGERSTVWARIFEMLENQYRNAVIEKYKKCYNEILRFGSYETYRVSHHPGTYEEYARSAALDEVMSLYAKTRYGGYMHVIIMRILEKHFEEEREQRQKELRGKAKEMTKVPELPENITAEEKRAKMERAKQLSRSFLNSDR